MRTRVTVLSLCVCVCVCVCVCYQFAGSISSLYNMFSTAIGFSLGLSDFQLTDLSKMPSFLRKSAFHGYFVVSNPHKRLCILHACALVVTWSTFILYRAHHRAYRLLSSWSWMINGAHLSSGSQE